MEGLIRYLRFFEFSVVTCFLTGLEITWATWDTCNITKVKINFITMVVSIQFHRFYTDCIYFQFKFLSCWTEIEPFLILVQFHFSRFITSLKMLFCKKVSQPSEFKSTFNFLRFSSNNFSHLHLFFENWWSVGWLTC